MTRGGPDVFLLRPFVPIPLPGVRGHRLRRVETAEERDPLPSRVVRKRMTRTAAWAGIGDLRPILPIPLPRVSCLMVSQLAAEEDDARTLFVVGQGMCRSSAGTDVRDLRPVVAVPDPGVSEQTPVPSVPAEEHDLLPGPVICNRMPEPGRGTDALSLRPEKFGHCSSLHVTFRRRPSRDTVLRHKSPAE